MKRTGKYLGQIIQTAIFGLFVSATDMSAATFVVDHTDNAGPGSLRQAIANANAAPGADTIAFGALFQSPQTITLATPITIRGDAGADTLTITGPGTNLLTIRSSGDITVRVFIHGANNSGDTLSISGITFAQSAGGNIQNWANLNISNCAFVNNIAGNVNGVGIENVVNTASLNVDNSVFSGNHAGTFAGGGIYSNGTLTVTNSTFSSNTARFGGAINSNGSLSVTGCTFTNNTVSFGGGSSGGAINSDSGVTPVAATITNSTFTGNAETSGGGGGAIKNAAGRMDISGSTFTGNSAFGGGAIRGGGRTNIDNSSFRANKAIGDNPQIGEGNGGAISQVDTAAQMIINNSIFSANEANNAGGGIYYQAGLMRVNNSTISNNNGGTAGGGIFNSGFDQIVNSSTISANRSRNGGGIYAIGALTLANSTVSGNYAFNYGGIQDDNPGGLADQVIIANSTIVNNYGVNFVGGFGVSDSPDQAATSNTIIANNVSGTGFPEIRGNIGSSGDNLIEAVGGGIVAPTDIVGLDPMLGPLAFNGGTTRTHALRAGSPAIDAGNETVFLPTDQRGIARPQDGGSGVARADIGAYERRRNMDLVHGVRYDFGGDGAAELSVFRPSTGEWYGIDLAFTIGSVEQWGVASDTLTPGDFDGNGSTEKAVWREDPNNPDKATFYINAPGINSPGCCRYEQFGRTGDNPSVVGDWDGDGTDDLAVYRDGGPNGQSYFFYRPSSQPMVNFITRPWGIGGDKPARGDYDGDGKLDLAVFRPSDGIWYIFQSSNEQVRYVKWGLSSDRLVQADYDGDGKTDPAVYRDGTWYITLSQASEFEAAYPRFGLSSDIPVPADYDGNGRAEVAVYRGGVWYMVDLFTGSRTARTWGLSTDIPIPNNGN